MLKEVLIILAVFGVGFLLLLPGPTQSPSTVSVLKKNVTVMENFDIHGNVSIGVVGKPVCIQIRDSDDGNWTKCTTLAGVMTCVAGAC